MIETAHVLAEGNPDTVALCQDGDQIDAALAASNGVRVRGAVIGELGGDHAHAARLAVGDA